MPEPAYHVRCSGKQDIHSKLVEEKVCWWSVPIRNACGSKSDMLRGCICQAKNVCYCACVSSAEFVVVLFYLVFAIGCMLFK